MSIHNSNVPTHIYNRPIKNGIANYYSSLIRCLNNIYDALSVAAKIIYSFHNRNIWKSASLFTQRKVYYTFEPLSFMALRINSGKIKCLRNYIILFLAESCLKLMNQKIPKYSVIRNLTGGKIFSLWSSTQPRIFYF